MYERIVSNSRDPARTDRQLSASRSSKSTGQLPESELAGTRLILRCRGREEGGLRIERDPEPIVRVGDPTSDLEIQASAVSRIYTDLKFGGSGLSDIRHSTFAPTMHHLTASDETDGFSGGGRERDNRLDERSIIRAIIDGGVALPHDVGDELQRFFGRDMSIVRTHADGFATTQANSLNAEAFTVGNHVFLGDPATLQYVDPVASVLVHEVAHVVQNEADITFHEDQRQIALRMQAKDGSAECNTKTPSVVDRVRKILLWGRNKYCTQFESGNIDDLEKKMKDGLEKIDWMTDAGKAAQFGMEIASVDSEKLARAIGYAVSRLKKFSSVADGAVVVEEKVSALCELLTALDTIPGHDKWDQVRAGRGFDMFFAAAGKLVGDQAGFASYANLLPYLNGFERIARYSRDRMEYIDNLEKDPSSPR